MILLDTHAWIWWLTRTGQLSDNERNALSAAAVRHELALSAISLWEAHMLHARDRIVLPTPFARWLPEATAADVVTIIPLEAEIVLALSELPASLHGDPADRIIAATARCKGMPLATWDKALRRSRAIEIWRV
jgi:PIN domain nuclease of toxin-antitoxin system